MELEDNEPAPRVSLAEHALTILRDDILNGRRGPGSPLSEKALASELEMSRSPIRTALATLQKEGLAEVGVRRQLEVARLTEAARVEVVLLRVAIETVVIRYLCEQLARGVIDIDQLDRLRLLVLKQRRAASERDVGRFLTLDEQFHLEMAELSGLRTAYRYLAELRGFVRLLRVGLPTDEQHMEHVAREHEQLVDAVETTDADAAAALLTHHIRSRAVRGPRGAA